MIHMPRRIYQRNTQLRHYDYAIVEVNWGFERSVGIQSYIGRVMMRQCYSSISAAKGRQNVFHICVI